MGETLRMLATVVKGEKGVSLAFLGNFANKMASLAAYTFATLLIQDSFPENE